MKTKKEFIEDVYFQCKSVMENGAVQKVTNNKGKILFKFYLDEGNETLQVYHEDGYKNLFNELDENTAFEYAKSIWVEYLGRDMEEFPDERVSALEKGISSWYETVERCTKDVESFFKKNKKIRTVEIDLPNDLYFLIGLERKVIFKYIGVNKEGKLIAGVSEPVYHDDQILDWYNYEIDFEYILQDAITLSDVMHEFYANTNI